MNTETIVQAITKQIMERLDQSGNIAPEHVYHVPGPSQDGKDGIFEDLEMAIDCACAAQQQLPKLGLEKRGRIIEAIRRAGEKNAELLAKITTEETGMGRPEDKVNRILLAALKSPGMEDIKPEVFAGDFGLTLVERQPFGVAVCITPSTNPTETTICNAIGMIVAGNSAVISPHPNAKKVTHKCVQIINEAIAQAGGPPNLIVTMTDPTLQKTMKLLKHPKISLVVATGGPGVVKAVMSSGKKAIGAGAGNPPALVDETADIVKAARDIVVGASFDNNLNCIGEKEVVVVESVADQLMAEFAKQPTYIMKERRDIDRLTSLLTTAEGDFDRDWVGKDAVCILQALDIEAPDNVKLIVYEVEADHITVMEEYMMPILPVVRVPNVQEGIRLAVLMEGGRHHTAVMHSKNVDNMTAFAQAVKTTIFVKNGSSLNGVGYLGEGHFTATIAGPTGEGLTSARTFTRAQRCVLVDGFNLRG
jgi:propionaldehyde dehydrogenase